MLISMPTGTSTIFGVFQAILALLLETGRNPSSWINYCLMKSSPVKSFVIIFPPDMLQCKIIHLFVRAGIKTKHGSKGSSSRMFGWRRPDGSGGLPDKELVM